MRTLQEHTKRLTKLTFLLQRSGIYSRIMGEKMAKERDARIAAAAAAASKENKDEKKQQQAQPAEKTRSSARTGAANAAGSAASKATSSAAAKKKETAAAGSSKSKKRGEQSLKVSEYLDEDDLAAAEAAADAAADETSGQGPKDGKLGASAESNGVHRTQPALVTGARMRDYQLDGTEWLISLYENGLNGILADEMGLGKTLQTIAFLAHLRAKGVWGPFLVVAPLSTINNWVMEFERFTPDIPALLYHGPATERDEMRRTRLKHPSAGKKKEEHDFPVVVTTYEIVIRDRDKLGKIDWKYIVVDEGHRLKNLNCRLIQELKKYSSANRLILTGTPLHVSMPKTAERSALGDVQLLTHRTSAM